MNNENHENVEPTILNIYARLKSKYRARREIVNAGDLKLKLSSLLKNTEKKDREKISQIIFGLIWADSDDLLRDKTERLWSPSGSNAIDISLSNLIPCTRGILNLFVDMYRNGQLSDFYESS